MTVAQDVTEAAKHDRAVAVMANELRQLVDTANAPIFGIDVDGKVNEWYVFNKIRRLRSTLRFSLRVSSLFCMNEANLLYNFASFRNNKTAGKTSSYPYICNALSL